MELLKKFFKEEDGQDLVEYALTIGGGSLAMLGGLIFLANAVNAGFSSVGAQVQTQTT
jgi:Flp pilus assembly pilin Flp